MINFRPFEFTRPRSTPDHGGGQGCEGFPPCATPGHKGIGLERIHLKIMPRLTPNPRLLRGGGRMTPSESFALPAPLRLRGRILRLITQVWESRVCTTSTTSDVGTCESDSDTVWSLNDDRRVGIPERGHDPSRRGD
jgi:hypothetical protein